MNIADLRLIRLDSEITLKPFMCSDSDLNDFLYEDALNYTNELLTVTYILEKDNETVAYFSILNDRIYLKNESPSIKNLFNRQIPNSKRLNSYPAVKIGRLAVSQNYANNGIGSQILYFVKSLFLTNNRTGCRFITVDAYRDALSFYEKNGFKYLTIKDSEEKTRLMYYDLKRFKIES